MELRGSLGGSVRLFLQRDAVDSVDNGSKRCHLSSSGAIVAPFIARQGLEVRVLHDPQTRWPARRFASLIATHITKNDATRQWRGTSVGRINEVIEYSAVCCGARVVLGTSWPKFDSTCPDRSRSTAALQNVCFWHKADMEIALGNVRFWG